MRSATLRRTSTTLASVLLYTSYNFLSYKLYLIQKYSCYIYINVLLVFVPPHVFLLDQLLDSLLYHPNVWCEVRFHGINCRSYKRLVAHRLLRFHNAHDGGIQIVFPVTVDRGLCLL